MICPDCQVKMIDKSYFYPDIKLYKTGQWTEKDAIFKHEEYWCMNCNIKYTNIDNWIIPSVSAITPKQKQAIWNCYNRLNIIDAQPITKKQAKVFLDKYMNLSIEASKQGLLTDKYNFEIERQREEAMLEWLQEQEQESRSR